MCCEIALAFRLVAVASCASCLGLAHFDRLGRDFQGCDLGINALRVPQKEYCCKRSENFWAVLGTGPKCPIACFAFLRRGFAAFFRVVCGPFFFLF